MRTFHVSQITFNKCAKLTPKATLFYVHSLRSTWRKYQLHFWRWLYRQLYINKESMGSLINNWGQCGKALPVTHKVQIRMNSFVGMH